MGWAHDVFVKMNEASAKRMRENERIEQQVVERKMKMSGNAGMCP